MYLRALGQDCSQALWDQYVSEGWSEEQILDSWEEDVARECGPSGGGSVRTLGMAPTAGLDMTTIAVGGGVLLLLLLLLRR